MEKILSGKPVSKFILTHLQSSFSNSFNPKMALIVVGKDPASRYYAENIIQKGSKFNFQFELIELAETISTRDLISIISALNTNDAIHGIIIQKPLPQSISEDKVNLEINPDKDIDGIHPLNLGKIFMNMDGLFPCTAKAVMELIKYYKIETRGKQVVILGRSSVVSKPLVGFLLQKNTHGNATITICHSYTKNLTSLTKTADILIAAIGNPNFVKSDMIKENAICIDVGINLLHDSDKGNIYVGDIDYNSCFDKSLSITPVPGGIGSITTSILLDNLSKAATKQIKDKNC